ncbi:hypothetical protein NKN81_004409 [Salmonella enterica]|nr:hypothetical protein [Salmonella enterica]
MNKAMLILAAAGLLSSAASYAADNTGATSGPQAATACSVNGYSSSSSGARR